MTVSCSSSTSSCTCRLMYFLLLTFIRLLIYFVVFSKVTIIVVLVAPPSGQLQRQSSSLFNWPALKGVLHKAAESTAGVCVSGVRAKFSKSSQCVSQWQHMLESLQRNARMHNLTCKQAEGHCAFCYRHKTTVWQSVCDVQQCTCKTCVDLSVCPYLSIYLFIYL